LKKIYIIAGPNGAGKTTLSYTILPEIFECDEFINADEIARGLSPLKPERVSLKAGRIMLERIKELMSNEESFAFETTLSTLSYKQLVIRAKSNGYKVILLFLALDSVQLAIERVKVRVSEGGHNIPKEVIERRFHRGIKNFFSHYMNIVDQWILVNNSEKGFKIIAEKIDKEIDVIERDRWDLLKNKYNEK